MDPQEITEELGHPGARNLLDSATLLRLAYNGSDGFPRVIPITEAKALLVRGLASVDIVNGVPDEYLAASTKVLGADQVTEFESQVRSMYDQMARISIEPVWARFFDFGAGRMPSFLTKLAGDA